MPVFIFVIVLITSKIIIFSQFQENLYDPKDMYENAKLLQLSPEQKEYYKERIEEENNFNFNNTPNNEITVASDQELEENFYQDNPQKQIKKSFHDLSDPGPRPSEAYEEDELYDF